MKWWKFLSFMFGKCEFELFLPIFLLGYKYSHYILGNLFFEDHSIPDVEEESDNWVFTALEGVKISLLVVIMFLLLH